MAATTARDIVNTHISAIGATHAYATEKRKTQTKINETDRRRHGVYKDGNQDRYAAALQLNTARKTHKARSASTSKRKVLPATKPDQT